MKQYVECSVCGKKIYFGEKVLTKPNYVGIFCSPNCFARGFEIGCCQPELDNDLAWRKGVSVKTEDTSTLDAGLNHEAKMEDAEDIKAVDQQTQINEMACVLGRGCDGCHDCCLKNKCELQEHAKNLYNAGYRKQSVGEWIYDNPNCLPKCSLCGARSHSAQWGSEKAYCGHCGAMMKDEDDVSDEKHLPSTLKNDEKVSVKVKQSEWISVDERLPEPFESVLVFCQWGRGEAQFVSEMIDNTDERRWSATCGLPVTHWMPLPEAPKMKGGE